MGTITSQIVQTFKKANIAATYGPYNNLSEAHAALSLSELNVIGMTVGIQSGNELVEYWYQGGTELENLVPKLPQNNQDNSTNLGELLIQVTHDELLRLVKNNQLIPGMQYELIDYIGYFTGMYKENNSIPAFNIILTADSKNTLNHKGRLSERYGYNYLSMYNYSHVMFKVPELNKYEVNYDLSIHGDHEGTKTIKFINIFLVISDGISEFMYLRNDEFEDENHKFVKYDPYNTNGMPLYLNLDNNKLYNFPNLDSENEAYSVFTRTTDTWFYQFKDFVNIDEVTYEKYDLYEFEYSPYIGKLKSIYVFKGICYYRLGYYEDGELTRFYDYNEVSFDFSSAEEGLITWMRDEFMNETPYNLINTYTDHFTFSDGYVDKDYRYDPVSLKINNKIINKDLIEKYSISLRTGDGFNGLQFSIPKISGYSYNNVIIYKEHYSIVLVGCNNCKLNLHNLSARLSIQYSLFININIPEYSGKGIEVNNSTNLDINTVHDVNADTLTNLMIRDDSNGNQVIFNLGDLANLLQ
jgi:hypothetical protein